MPCHFESLSKFARKCLILSSITTQLFKNNGSWKCSSFLLKHMSLEMLSDIQSKLLPISCLNFCITHNDLNYWNAHLSYYLIEFIQRYNVHRFCNNGIEKNILFENQFCLQLSHSAKHTVIQLMTQLL